MDTPWAINVTPVAGLNCSQKKSSIFRTLLRSRILRIFSSNVKVNAVFSWKRQNSFQRIFPPYSQHLTTPQISFKFSGFYYTSNSFLIKTNQHKRSENLPFSGNLVIADRKRRGQGGVMWTKDHWRSDANHTGSIWFRVRQRITLSWGSWGCRKVALMPHPLKWPPQASLGAFPFAVWKNWKGEIHESTAQRKEYSKMEFEKKNSEKKFGESETFCRSKFSRATCVIHTLPMLFPCWNSQSFHLHVGGSHVWIHKPW